jgi:hypothetical protein
MKKTEKIDVVVTPENDVTAPEIAVEKTALELQIEKLTKITEELVKANQEKDESIRALTEMAEAGTREKIDSKKRMKIIPRVRVTTINGKVVVKSKTLIDMVYKDLSDGGKWIEKQIHNYTFDDGSNMDLNLVDYTRNKVLVDADVLAIREVPEKETEDGTKFYQYTVKLLDSGKELTLDYQYIN